MGDHRCAVIRIHVRVSVLFLARAADEPSVWIRGCRGSAGRPRDRCRRSRREVLQPGRRGDVGAARRGHARRSRAAGADAEGYGLTEASPVLTMNPLDEKGRLGTIGLPAPSTLIRLVDDDGKDVPLGETGEIIAQGPQVMQGYYNRPDETDKVIKEGWLYTGDMGVMDTDGYVRIVDRKKDMILVSGFNVYPNEIEDIVATCPGVLEVAAVGVADEKSGEAVKIFVVKKDPNLTKEAIINHCRQHLTGYKVPKFCEFREELPKTNVGKILRRMLKD